MTEGERIRVTFYEHRRELSPTITNELGKPLPQSIQASAGTNTTLQYSVNDKVDRVYSGKLAPLQPVRIIPLVRHQLLHSLVVE